MSFFSKLFGGENNTTNTTQQQTHKTERVTTEVFLDTSKAGPLNIQKNQILNLTKSNTPLSKLRFAAGWDFVANKTIDLDLVAYLSDNNGNIVETVYFGRMKTSGVRLSGDNLTGEGDGDDETIFIDLSNVKHNVHKITLAVVLYNQTSYSFKDVKNAYCRLVDDSSGREREIVRQNLSIPKSNSTAVILAELNKTNNEWNYVAIDEYYKARIDGLKAYI